MPTKLTTTVDKIKRLTNKKNSDENSTNVKASFPCDKCDQTFGSRQKLKEPGRTAHQLL